MKLGGQIMLLLTGLVISMAAGCADRRLQEAPQQTQRAPDRLPVHTAAVESQIGPAGGTLEHPTGAKLVVPAGALEAPTRLSFVGIDAPNEAVLDGRALGQAFRAEPAGQTFLKPVEVVLPFDPTRLQAPAELHDAVMKFAPTETAPFTAIQTDVDLTNRVLRARTVHFTVFVPAQNPNPVFITSGERLPNATVGVAYDAAITATGGSAPHTFAIASGLLPPGLSLTSAGHVTGTPTVPSAFSFFVSATDAIGRSVQIAQSLSVVLPNNPLPVLASVSPSTIATGAAATIAIRGSSFVLPSEVRWDGVAVPSVYVSSSELTATISASLLQTSGSHVVTVFSPGPGGGTTTGLTVTVVPSTGNAPEPVVDSVSPRVLPVATTDAQITVTGSDFVPATSVVIGGQGLSTTYVSSTELRASIPASYLSSAVVLMIGAYTPPIGGGFARRSRELSVGSLYPKPTLSAYSPSALRTGAAGQLTLRGSGFVIGGVAFAGSTALETNVQDSNTASAKVPSYLLMSPGALSIVFINPAPGGGASGALSVPVATNVDGGADASLDAGAPDSSSCGNHTVTEPTRVVVSQDDPYSWRYARGSTTITSCATGEVVLRMTNSGTATARLDPGRYIVWPEAAVKPDPDPDPMHDWYYEPTIVYEPLAPPALNTTPATATYIDFGATTTARVTEAAETLYYRVVYDGADHFGVSIQVREPVAVEMTVARVAAAALAGCNFTNGFNVMSPGSCGADVGSPAPPGEYLVTVRVGAGGRLTLSPGRSD